MRKMICAPGSYIQGPGELKALADHVKALRGNKAYLIVDAFVDSVYHQDIVSSFEKQAIAYGLEVFGGECCMEEIEKHQKQRKDSFNSHSHLQKVKGVCRPHTPLRFDFRLFISR